MTPDLVTYGKIIGAGMPVGAYGGRREIMELVSPVGKVYQAGTLSGNPIAMAAGLTQLKYLYEHQEIYKDLEEKGKRLYGGMEKILVEKNLPYHINHVSSLGKPVLYRAGGCGLYISQIFRYKSFLGIFQGNACAGNPYGSVTV